VVKARAKKRALGQKAKVKSVTKSSGGTKLKVKPAAKKKVVKAKIQAKPLIKGMAKSQKKSASQRVSKGKTVKSNHNKIQLRKSSKVKGNLAEIPTISTKNKTHHFNFKPLDDRILVKLVPSEVVTRGGIIIPDTVTSDVQSYLKAQVVAVGPGKKNKKGRVLPTEVVKGDTVIFPRYAGEKIEIEGVTHFIVRESDLLGVAP
jgi:chaperonin GroES